MEILIVIAIIGILIAISVTVFKRFNSLERISKDAELVVEVIRQARSRTVASEGAQVYGVHFESGSVTLFTGSTYSAGALDNQVYLLTVPNTISTITLSGGGSDVLFARLTGEATKNGTITLTSPQTPRTKVVTIYKTGLVESN